MDMANAREIDALVEQRAIELLTEANPVESAEMRIEAQANWRSKDGTDFGGLLDAHPIKDWPDVIRRMIQDYWMTKFRQQAANEIMGRTQ